MRKVITEDFKTEVVSFYLSKPITVKNIYK